MLDYALSIRLFTDSAMVILIWLVQIIIYPAYRSIDESVFTSWHSRYMKQISYFVIPLITIQTLGSIALLAEAPTTLRIVDFLFIMLAWGVTFSWSVPCHKKLKVVGKDLETINRLIKTNWARTFAWTMVMVIRCIPD